MLAKRFVLLTGLSAALVLPLVVMAESHSELALGRRVYELHCAVCHGEKGDGRGDAASRFVTAPRDFTKGKYKIRSTASGQPPTDADLIRSITQGLPGTAMVPQDHLTEAEVRAVITVIKSLSPKFVAHPSPKVLPIPPPPLHTPEAVARGRQAYVKGECAECHGSEGRGDGPSAPDLSVKPTDLTRRPLKSGSTARDVVRSVLTGLDDTPMPSYHLILEDRELWELAYYVVSLAGPPEMTDDERAGWEVEGRHKRH